MIKKSPRNSYKKRVQDLFPESKAWKVGRKKWRILTSQGHVIGEHISPGKAWENAAKLFKLT